MDICGTRSRWVKICSWKVNKYMYRLFRWTKISGVEINVLCAWVAFFNGQSFLTRFRRWENVKRWIWPRLISVIWPQHVSTWYPYPNGRPQVFNALHRTTLNMFSDGVVWIPPAFMRMFSVSTWLSNRYIQGWFYTCTQPMRDVVIK